MTHGRPYGSSMALAALLAIAGSRAQAQTVPPPYRAQNPIPSAGTDRSGIPDPLASNPALEQKQVAVQNSDRQRRLVADTDKLLALATQLHADVAKTDKNILSIDVVKRAEEIERLAKSVKERMKG